MSGQYHEPELIASVTAYANEHGPTNAARKYGLDPNLVKQWQYRARHRKRDQPAKKAKPSLEERAAQRALKAAEKQEAAIDEIPVEAPEPEAAPTPEAVARECYRVALKAVAKIEATLGREPKVVHGHWLHSLSGSLKILTTTAQLLSGQPTERTEGTVAGKVKYDLINRLTSDRALADRAVPVLTDLFAEPGGNGQKPGSADN